MWNFSFVIPSFMILLILLGYYFYRPKLSIRINDTFVSLLVTDFLVILFDMLSSAADNHYERFSVTCLSVLNLLYFVFFLARIFCFFCFLSDVLKMKLFRSPQRLAAYGSVFFAAELLTLASPFSGTVFYIGTDGYHSGPFYNVLYVTFIYYIVLSLILIKRRGAQLKKEERLVAVLYNVILLAGNVIRFLFPTYLIMNTFCLMAIIMIYLTFMNPDFYRSDRGLAFNDRAFRTVLDEMYGSKPFRVLCLGLRGYSDAREIYGAHQMDVGISLIADYLTRTFRDTEVFYLRNGRFALVGDAGMDWDYIRSSIDRRFQKPWRAEETDLFLNVLFVRVSERSAWTDADTMLRRLLSAFREAEGNMSEAGGLTDLDEIVDIDRHVDLKRTLERAVEENRVEIFLQPIIHSSTDRMVGAEVLARIRGEDGQPVSPNLFIPIAEQNGQINKLGRQVFEKTCAFIHDGNLERTGLEWLNVNLSMIQCMKRDLAVEFCGIMESFGVSADMLHFEVTEAAVIDMQLLDRQITALREAGFKLALDDYGSGYSNLTRVKHYPFSNIKFDMEVIWDYFRDKDVLLPSIVSAFKQLNLSVTAEGIETEEMAEEMKRIGFDYLQGYYYSQPIPADEFVRKYAK